MKGILHYFSKWTPCLHKILAHVIDVRNSTPLKMCGGLAAKASEGRNKNFCADKKHHSRQNLVYEFEDNLCWSYNPDTFTKLTIIKNKTTPLIIQATRVFGAGFMNDDLYTCHNKNYKENVLVSPPDAPLLQYVEISKSSPGGHRQPFQINFNHINSSSVYFY